MSFTLKSNIPQLTGTLKARASQVVHNTAFSVELHIKASMVEPKSGRAYKRGKAPGVGKRGKRLKDRRKTHIASAPGQAPAVDEGALRASLNTEMTGETSAVVGTNMEYAEALEFGTHKMAPRPFFAPAFEKAKPEFEAGLKELLK